MGHFLDVAKTILELCNRPMSAKDITEYALINNLLNTKGKTPFQTMKSKLSTDILKKKKNSCFMRSEQGLFALRSWQQQDEVNEYVADRFLKSIMDEEIAVFPKSSLYKYISGSGLHTLPIKNGRDLLGECYPMSRNKAENDFSVIQLVSVFIVHFQKKILTYKRTKRLPENRLHGFYSIGFGGHVNISEVRSLFNIFDPCHSGALSRELMEELRIDCDEKSIVYKGLIYDDSRSISSQHLGIVYDVCLASSNFEIGERGFLTDPKFESLHEIYARLDQFENWSALLVNFERKNIMAF